MPKLIIAGTAHELAEQVITIGRSPESLIRIDDASVSSRHAELRAAEASYLVRDLGSTNGTHVNGKAVREVALKNGDRVRFGAVQARFEADVPASAAQPLPVAEKVEARTATTSVCPADFANASPFRARKMQRDQARTLLFVAAGVALLALAAALVAVLAMHAPVP